MKTVVLGAGGFIGGHLVSRLHDEGHDVNAVDVKSFGEWHQSHAAGNVRNFCDFDVAHPDNFDFLTRLMEGADEVYCLAADMGGMGFIENNKLLCMLTVKTSVAALEAANKAEVGRFFYSSSACVYPGYRQGETDVPALSESDAYPADSEDGYGWEKLFTERLARHYWEDCGLETRVARYHNVYGPMGTWAGGREKAPAAICRKVAVAALTGGDTIDIWGDGEQTRSFMYVDDCVEGTTRLTRSEVREPLNIGSDELVSVNELVSLVETIAGVKLERVYDLAAPQGVRGRNSENTLIKRRLGWAPSISLGDGMEKTYAWVYDQVKAAM